MFIEDLGVNVTAALHEAVTNLVECIELAHTFARDGIFSAQEGKFQFSFKILSKCIQGKNH